CEGDVAVSEGLEVRIGAAGPRHASPADPVHLPAPWILHRGDLFVKDTAAEVRDLHPYHRIAGNGGQVDVEQGLPREILDLDDALDQALETWTMALELLEIEAAVGDRDARNPGRQPLHGSRDGAGIEHILAHVRAVVHSRHDPV